jgi:hypothetical protein
VRSFGLLSIDVGTKAVVDTLVLVSDADHGGEKLGDGLVAQV